MGRNFELKPRELKNYCDLSKFNFETTKELKPKDTVIGQERGIKALNFGLNINIAGYNIYAEGPTGVGKTMYIKRVIDEYALKKKVPNDWVYVYNFSNPNEPVAISLPAGLGKEFKDDVAVFIKELRQDISKTFVNEDYEREKNMISSQYEEKRQVLLKKLNEDALNAGFEIKNSQGRYISSSYYRG